MAVTIQLDADLEKHLRQEVANLDDAAKEALLVSLYRRGTLSHAELGRALVLDRLETEAVLKRHNVTEDLPSLDDLRADGDTLHTILRSGA